MTLIRRFEAALNGRPDRGFQLYSSGEEAVVGTALSWRPAPFPASVHSTLLARGIAPELAEAELPAARSQPRHGRGQVDQASSTPSAGPQYRHRGRCGARRPARGQGPHRGLYFRRRGLWGGRAARDLEHRRRALRAAGPGLRQQRVVVLASAQVLAPQQADLAAPFGIPGATVDGMDVEAVRDQAADFAARARSGEGPALLECLSERFFSHSTATRETRSVRTMQAVLERCPIQRSSSRAPPVNWTMPCWRAFEG